MSSIAPKKVIVIGAAGKQGSEYLKVLKQLRNTVEIVGLVDQQYRTNQFVVHGGISHFTTLDDAIKHIQFDVALLAVPHDHHYHLTKQLLRSGKHIIKEKPFAFSKDEAKEIMQLMKRSQSHVLVTVQRRYYESFIKGKELFYHIGRPYFFKYEYYKDFSKPTPGWRGKVKTALGGVLLDMGYHAIDILTMYFGELLDNQPVLQYCFEEMRREGLEDIIQTNLFYGDKFHIVPGVLSVSRHHYRNVEKFEIFGDKGTLVIEPEQCFLTAIGGGEAKVFNYPDSKNDSVKEMLQDYIRHIDNSSYVQQHVNEQYLNVKSIESIYSESEIYQTLNTKYLPNQFVHLPFQSMKEVSYGL